MVILKLYLSDDRQMNEPGKLYVVATPIGNLEDISPRALRVLGEVDVIAAEDTRHSRKLLDRYGISTPLVSHHQHNQSKTVGRLINRLRKGENIALISDAGTPLISDPGATLVRSAHDCGAKVIPIPGASALTCALSVCGFEISQFHFEGFLPAKRLARIQRLKELAVQNCCLVFFEAPHRIKQSLKDMAEVLGQDHPACIVREMTKLHENIHRGSVGELSQQFCDQPASRRGEFVVIVKHSAEKKREISPEVEKNLSILLDELSPKKAAKVAADIFGLGRNALYKQTLKMHKAKGKSRESGRKD